MNELMEFLNRHGVSYRVEGDIVVVDGSLSLSSNQLTSLPESFGNLKVGGHLDLFNNQLTSLPESFGNLKVGGSLSLSSNQLTSLPESFGNLKVGGDLYLYNNRLTSLPESFGNLKVGGDLYLHNNQLTSIPIIPRMDGNIIESDWCYIDGIVREVVSKKQVDGLTIIKTPFDYVVGKDDVWAHGKTTKDAIEDYRFKLLRKDPEELKSLDLDAPMSHADAINAYRAVTGACREGVRQWMQGKQLPDPITIRQIVQMTSDAYGGSEFARFFGEVGR